MGNIRAIEHRKKIMVNFSFLGVCISLVFAFGPVACFQGNGLALQPPKTHHARSYFTGTSLQTKKERSLKMVEDESLINRRQALVYTFGIVFGTIIAPDFAEASGLLSFPPKTPLNNRYFAVRSGESEADAAGIVATNPAYKLSMENGLTMNGLNQVDDAAARLELMGVDGSGCFVWYSTTTRSTQTADRIGELLGVGRERLVPEFTFLDARGLGAYDGKNLSEALAKVYTEDQTNPDYRPPENYDGTLNESARDLFVRVRQLISITETQYIGEDIIFVSPDSDTLSVLEASLTGTSLNYHRKFAYKNGEVRLLEPFISCETKRLPQLC